MTRGERGSATLLAISALSVLLVLCAALGVVMAMVGAHRRAQSAADLAALAGAQALALGRDPCGAAARIAIANGADLAGCVRAGDQVTVQVEVLGPHWLGQAADFVGRARAGPAGPG